MRSRADGRPSKLLASLVTTAVVLVGCASSGGAPPTADLTPAEAYTAIVRWELDRGEPTLDDKGNPVMPVIYVAAASGTVDIGVQAEVVAATSDVATVRFADTTVDSIDEEIVDQPVKDDGVMYVIGAVPVEAASADVTVRRYRSVSADVTYLMTIVASDDGGKVLDAVEQQPVSG
jgi:hypothetical protein